MGSLPCASLIVSPIIDPGTVPSRHATRITVLDRIRRPQRHTSPTTMLPRPRSPFPTWTTIMVCLTELPLTCLQPTVVGAATVSLNYTIYEGLGFSMARMPS